MKLLALETATEACSVALYLDGEILARHALAPRRHAELTLPWMAELLDEAGIVRSQLDAIACGCGPGAFTGVRLAVAMAQGLALALDRPLLAVSTLEALALPAMQALDQAQEGHQAGEPAAGVIAAIDARMDEIYWACYLPDAQGQWQRQGEEAVVAPAAARWPQGRRWFALGTGLAACGGILAQRLAAESIRCQPEALPHAADVARLGAAALARGQGLAPEAVQPAYLRNKVALTLREQGKPLPEGLEQIGTTATPAAAE